MKVKILVVAVVVLIWSAVTANGYTREEVIKRGFLQCGVSTGAPGFSSVDSKGVWSGIDIDLCRAVAVATLGDAQKVEYKPLAADESFTALLSGEVDILARHSSWTFTRDSALAVHFAGISYYDGQGFLAAVKLGAERANDLKKVKVCSRAGSTAEANLKDYFKRSKTGYKIVPYESLDLAVKGFENEACDLLSLPVSQLHGIRGELSNPQRAIIFSEVITKEPLGPVVRQGDDNWFNIVKWSLWALINGEELGISSDNVEVMRISNKLDVKRFFGLKGSGGKGLGIRNDWAAEIIRQVGNYGEVFERNLGKSSSLKIERGLNNLWRNGGLQYAPPLR